LQIAVQKGKKILVDEIDSGIHYSNFSSFWKNIIHFCNIYDVQIFATTHNFECINYFKEILNDRDFEQFKDNSRIITLRQLPNNQIKAYTRVFEEFEYEIDNNFEIRGGELL
jgi:AAA15 family ATPase/GTPase